MKSLPLLSIKNALKNGPFRLLLNGGGGGIWSYSLAGNGNSAFCYEITSQTQKAPASAHSRNPRKSVFFPTPHKIKTGLTNVSPFL